MKDFDTLVRERRSIRKYKNTPVEKEKIDMLLEAARLAPSACNAQPWRFVAVTDETLCRQLFEEGLGKPPATNSWAKTAPAFIVACSNLSLFTHTLAERVQGVHYHLIDMGIALEHIALKAVELDLGTCYIGWFKSKPIQKLLHLPSGWKIECILTLGYPADTPPPSPRKPLAEMAFFNTVK